MKRLLKKGTALLCACILILLCAVQVHAAQPEENVAVPANVAFALVDLSVQLPDSLKISIVSNFVVNNSEVDRVLITTYIEKRTLLFFWERVDFGTTTDQWVDTFYTDCDSVGHTFQLDSSGTYRVTSVFKAYNGSTLLETLERTITVS